MEWLILGALAAWVLGQKGGAGISGIVAPISGKATVPDPTVLPYRQVGYEPAVAAVQDPAQESDPTESGQGDVTEEDVQDIINESPDPEGI